MNLDLILLLMFLALNLIVGLRHSYKIKDLKEYALGNQNFSTATVTATVVASWMGGGSLLIGLSKVYSEGLYYLIVMLGGGVLCAVLVAQVFSIRMGEFLGNLSIAEAMRDLYGKKTQLITALGGILRAIGSVAIQFKVIAKVLALFFGIEGQYVTMAAAVIVIVYAVLGGLKAVTFTDAVQFCTFGAVIPILAIFIHDKLQDPNKIIQTLTTNPIFDFHALIANKPRLIASLSLMCYFMIPDMGSPFFQRIAMARDVWQVKRSYLHTAWILLLVKLSIVWVAILLLTDNPHLPSNNLLNYIIEKYALYTGIKGLIAIGVMAMAISTADSYINAGAVLFANDIAKPLGWYSKPKHSLVLAQGFSLLLGVFALLLALYMEDLLEIALLAASLYMPIVTVPFLLAVLGFRSSTKAVLTGMAAGFMTVIGWKGFLGHTGIDSVIPGFLANLIFFISSHYLFFKEPQTGWVGVKDDTALKDAKIKRHWFWKERMNALQEFHFLSFLQKILPQKPSTYTSFGVYVLATTFFLRFTHQQATYHFLYFCMMMLGTFFIIYPIYAARLTHKWIITFTWPLGIFLLLFIGGSSLFIINEFQLATGILLLTNLVVAILLLPWALVLLMTIIGIGFSVCFYQYLAASTIALVNFPTIEYKFIYGIALCSIFVFSLLKSKQDKQQLAASVSYFRKGQAANAQEYLYTLHYQHYLKDSLEGKTIDYPVVSTKKYLTSLAQQIPNQKQALAKVADQLEALVAYHKNSFYYLMDHLMLNVSKVQLEALLHKVYISLQRLKLHEHVFFKINTQQKTLVCDEAKIIQLLVTSISALQEQLVQDHTVKLYIQDTKLSYQFKVVPNKRELAALAFILTTAKELDLPKACYQGNTAQPLFSIPENITTLLQRENGRIIDAHYGHSDTLATPSASRQIHVIPVNLREIRPKVIDLEPMTSKVMPLDNAASIKQEKALLDQLAAQTKLTPCLAQEVIDYVKQVHQGQRRKSGDLFYTHPMTVASFLLTMTQDPDAIIAALLHDTVEDTLLRLDYVAYKYGKAVAFIVRKVTHLNLTVKKSKLTEQENQAQLACHHDPRVVMVKLADRLHNMRTIQFHISKRQKEIAQETLAFYVPLGRKLGLPAVDKIVDEIEERCVGLLA